MEGFYSYTTSDLTCLRMVLSSPSEDHQDQTPDEDTAQEPATDEGKRTSPTTSSAVFFFPGASTKVYLDNIEQEK
jgi:hypothetical protein